MPKPRSTPGPWGPLALQPGHSLGGAFGPLRLWIRRAETDWFCANAWPEEDPAPFGMEAGAVAPDEVEWNRLGCEDASREIRLQPALPDRAVVVRPEMPFTILPGDRIKFFVRIPLWVQLVTSDGEPSVWSDLPSRVLSKTWFGSPESGELAYALRTLAVRSLAGLERAPDRIICPVRVRNQSDDVLRLARICLRVQHLTVYQGATSLWTNEAGVTYRGGDEWSRVAYGRSEPPFDQAKQRRADPRDPTRGAFSLRSIATRELFS